MAYEDPPLRIVGGDSKDKLFAQLSDIGRAKPRPTFTLTIQVPGQPERVSAGQMKYRGDIRVHINGITATDSVGDYWTITGYPVDCDKDLDIDSGQLAPFTGTYSTRTRTGFLRRAG